MNEYHKIHTIYLRDPATKHKTLLEGQFAKPELEYLAGNQWVWTEKVDGTNIRVKYEYGRVSFAGKTDAAQIPVPLLDRLRERFTVRRMALAFDASDACLYGEGYGAKIQKGGGNYRPDQDFVLFDVRVGGWWLSRADVEDVARTLGVDAVPVIGEGTLHEAVAVVRQGFASLWGEFTAEGIVARPRVELMARDGSRIITKIKHRDFGG